MGLSYELIPRGRYPLDALRFSNRSEDRLACGYDCQCADEAHFHAFQGPAAQGENGIPVILRVNRVTVLARPS